MVFTNKKQKKGCTILEVLVAMSILTIALVTIYQSFATSLFLTASTSNLWKAMIFSQTQLLANERETSNPVSFNQGSFRDPDPMDGYRWKKEVKDVMPFPGIRVRKITYELRWDEGDTEFSYSSDIYVESK